MRHHAVELTLRERLSQINYPAGKCAVCNQIQNGMSPNRGEEGANTEKRNTRGDWTRSTSGIALSALNVLASVCTLYIVLEFPPPHPKLLRTPQFLTHFTSKCASRHNAVHFFNINFQKVLCTFSLRNRLRAATACTFSSLISPDVSALAALASLLFNPLEPQNH